jgi:hypothetical protein
MRGNAEPSLSAERKKPRPLKSTWAENQVIVYDIFRE